MTEKPTDVATGSLNSEVGERHLNTEDAPFTVSETPTRVGRYVVFSKLGQGGFADVFLAQDEELRRQVALKMPRANKFRTVEECQVFIEEARTSAKLQHPGIVTVFDVGLHNGAPFIVLEYIRGRSLSNLLENEPLAITSAVRMMVAIAEAIAHAHERGFVHRDIKPQNILLDTNDRPKIADFGLAVNRWDVPEMGDYIIGTSSYMAPEQVRGETHRIDARTDVWALGVVLYNMLTRKSPFNGSTRREIFQQILYQEPVKPTRIEERIPLELERICLRCLCKQMADRYLRVSEFIADLNEWLDLTASGSDSGRRRRPTYIEPPDARVVPRGLRSFEREDGDFFLRLLPGPRDRDGLPASVRFWKKHLEEQDKDETFRVGVLYGPSGCGKSSLIKAGVMSRLDSHIATVRLEANPQGTEQRLFNLLNKLSREKSNETQLDELMRRLREQSELRAEKKIVIVIDQFEQWLDGWSANPKSTLVNALRQCDGSNIQAVLMVRDDFWLPLSRLMRELELPIIDGFNSMLVDSFDRNHARRVLQELGVAYGRLARNTEPSHEQKTFIDLAINDLSESNRLYPVQLSVFVEMVKDRDWTPETHSDMGGKEGVGVAFLESSFGNRAPQSRRIHEAAVRCILAALLPTSGEIKDRVRSRSELLEASKYAHRVHDFDAVMRLLDTDLRLVSHAQFVGSDDTIEQAGVSDSSPLLDASNSEGVYQLTHDFLVPSIREWLERQSRGSRRGRAQLLLQEQAGIWNSRPSPRYLPSLPEWLGIYLRTVRAEWTEPQARMMRAATNRFLSIAAKWGIVSLGLVIGSFWIVQQAVLARNINDAKVLVSSLQKVDIVDVPELISGMGRYRQWVDPALQKIFDGPNEIPQRKTRAAMALLPSDDRMASWLADQLLATEVPSKDWLSIRKMLQPYRSVVENTLMPVALDAKSDSPTRFRALTAMAEWDQGRDFWTQHGSDLCRMLLQQPPHETSDWVNALKPIATSLHEPLIEQLRENQSPATLKLGCTALSEFFPNDASAIVLVLGTTDGAAYRTVIDFLEQLPTNLQSLRTRYQSLRSLVLSPAAKNELSNSQLLNVRNIVVAMWELGDSEPLRECVSAEGNASLRTHIVHALTPDRVSFQRLNAMLMEHDIDDPRTTTAMLGTTNFLTEPLSDREKAAVVQRAAICFQQARQAETHSVAELLLRKLNADREVSVKPTTDFTELKNNWYTSPSGLTFAILPVDVPETADANDNQDALNIGSDARTTNTEVKSDPTPTSRLAISTTEVPIRLYSQLVPSYERIALTEASLAVPVSKLLVVQMASFCNWLSESEGISSDELCYPPTSEMTVTKCSPVEGWQSKTGYRLPTVAEWSLASKAGLAQPEFLGTSKTYLNLYAWTQENSNLILHSGGSLLPNRLGLFDVYGNTAEACMEISDQWNPSEPLLFSSMGGTALMRNERLLTQLKVPLDQASRFDFVGMRLVRRIPQIPTEQ